MEMVEHAVSSRASLDVPYFTHGLPSCWYVFHPIATAVQVCHRSESAVVMSEGVLFGLVSRNSQLGPLMAMRCCVGVVLSAGIAG